MYPLQKLQKCLQQTVLTKHVQNNSAKIYSEVCNAVHFRLCIDLMHNITPPVTAEGFDGSHHPRYADCSLNSIFFVYLSSLPVAHLRKRLVVTGDSVRIQDETTENSAWFFNVLGV